MRAKHVFRLAATLVSTLLFTGGPHGSAHGQEKSAGASDAKKLQDRKVRPKRPAQYVPNGGTPPGRREDGGVRSEDEGVVPTKLLVVAEPGKSGWTTQARPVLFWFVSDPTDRPVNVTINSLKDKNTLLDVTLKGPEKAGVQRLDLSTLPEAKQLALEPGVKYEWVVRIAASDDPDANDAVATCNVMRLDAEKIPEAVSKAEDAAERANACAKNGIWFDYYAALDEVIRDAPDDVAWQDARDAALRKAGLGIVADAFKHHDPSAGRNPRAQSPRAP
jgi:hypothetical protein